MLSVNGLKRKRSSILAQATCSTKTSKKVKVTPTSSTLLEDTRGDTSALSKGLAEMNKLLNSSLSASTVTEYKVNTPFGYY